MKITTHTTKLLTIAAGMMVATSLPTVAQSITYNLGGSGGDGVIGNIRTFGGVITASAWSYNSSDVLEKAALGRYSSGLGVLNKNDGSHTVDNDGQKDYVLFVFNQGLDISNVAIQGFGDTDVSYWVGNLTSSVLTNLSYGGLSSLGFGSEKTVDGSDTTSLVNVGINSPLTGVNALLFGTKSTSSNDSFKIKSITVSPAAVPEPSSAVLSLIGVCGLLAVRRR